MMHIFDVATVLVGLSLQLVGGLKVYISCNITGYHLFSM